MIGPGVGVRGPNPLEPRQESGQAPTSRVKRNEVSERVPPAGGDQGLGQGYNCEQIRRSRLTIFVKSVK
jgi:hypothetical protein